MNTSPTCVQTQTHTGQGEQHQGNLKLTVSAGHIHHDAFTEVDEGIFVTPHQRSDQAPPALAAKPFETRQDSEHVHKVPLLEEQYATCTYSMKISTYVVYSAKGRPAYTRPILTHDPLQMLSNLTGETDLPDPERRRSRRDSPTFAPILSPVPQGTRRP